MYVPSIRTGYQYRHIWTHLSLCWRTAHSIILLLLIIIAVIIICITNTQHCFALIVTLLFFLKFKEFYHIILLVPHFAYALHSAITADKQLTIPVWVTGIDHFCLSYGDRPVISLLTKLNEASKTLFNFRESQEKERDDNGLIFKLLLQ